MVIYLLLIRHLESLQERVCRLRHWVIVKIPVQNYSHYDICKNFNITTTCTHKHTHTHTHRSSCNLIFCSVSIITCLSQAEGNTLRVPENRVLRRSVDQRKRTQNILNHGLNDELHNLYFTIVRIIPILTIIINIIA
jgi:hypothetical protein